MKSILTFGFVSLVALLTSRCSVTTQPQELNYTKQSRGVHLAPSCSAGKELKDSEALEETFSALLGPEASHFVSTNHNQFALLDQLAAQGEDEETVRSYLKTLHRLAEDAASLCSQPEAASRPSCRCSKLAEAQSLLARAVPRDHCELAPGLAEELALACQQNYRTAVSSLFSSLALARRAR